MPIIRRLNEGLPPYFLAKRKVLSQIIYNNPTYSRPRSAVICARTAASIHSGAAKEEYPVPLIALPPWAAIILHRGRLLVYEAVLSACPSKMRGSTAHRWCRAGRIDPLRNRPRLLQRQRRTDPQRPGLPDTDWDSGCFRPGSSSEVHLSPGCSHFSGKP